MKCLESTQQVRAVAGPTHTASSDSSSSLRSEAPLQDGGAACCCLASWGEGASRELPDLCNSTVK